MSGKERKLYAPYIHGDSSLILYYECYNKFVKNKVTFKKFIGHFKTINKHKFLVTSFCFKCGLIKQGFLHDLSKYSPIEFWSGVKYYQGYRSPVVAERETIGYSLGWLHHQGRNKHHWEYWIDKDYSDLTLKVLKMPLNYIIESTLDRIAASKVYNHDYNDSSAYDFLMKGKDRNFMGLENLRRYELLLSYLAINGETKALEYYKDLYLKWKKDKKFDI